MWHLQNNRITNDVAALKDDNEPSEEYCRSGDRYAFQGLAIIIFVL